MPQSAAAWVALESTAPSQVKQKSSTKASSPYEDYEEHRKRIKMAKRPAEPIGGDLEIGGECDIATRTSPNRKLTVASILGPAHQV